MSASWGGEIASQCKLLQCTTPFFIKFTHLLFSLTHRMVITRVRYVTVIRASLGFFFSEIAYAFKLLARRTVVTRG